MLCFGKNSPSKCRLDVKTSSVFTMWKSSPNVTVLWFIVCLLQPYLTAYQSNKLIILSSKDLRKLPKYLFKPLNLDTTSSYEWSSEFKKNWFKKQIKFIQEKKYLGVSPEQHLNKLKRKDIITYQEVDK